MTWRARWLFSLALLCLWLGAVRYQFLLSLVSLSIIVWMLAEWWRFSWWLRMQFPKLKVQRSVNGRLSQPGIVDTLWTGRRLTIELQIAAPRPTKAHIRLRDFVPEYLEIVSPEAVPDSSHPHLKPDNPWATRVALETQSNWLNDAWDRWSHRLRMWLGDPLPAVRQELLMFVGMQSARMSYQAFARSAGRFTMPGVRVVLEDMYGLFRVNRFIEAPAQYRVLAAYYESGEMRPTVKRHNSLPRHGIHRLQRSGMGSELLELREYVPGDPPKSIAWKVSARRDKLLTLQYESEVPVRVHLIIDGTIPTRVGGFGFRLLDQINYVAASVAQAAIAVGDPVNCSLVDESGIKRLPWFSGDRGLMELLKSLSDFSLKPPPTVGPTTYWLKQHAMTICHERYPELLERRVNRTPWAWLRETHERYVLANVVSQLYNLPSREHAICMLNDEALAQRLQQLLHDSGAPWMAPLLPAPDEPTRSSIERMQVISQAILRAIMHAHDNEVFVILADLFSAAPNFVALQRAIKMAVSKHHRVAFVCPTTTLQRPKVEAVLPVTQNVADLLYAAERTRVRDLSLDLKRHLTQLGAAVSFSGEQSAIELVLAEIDTARTGRARQGLRR